MKVMASLLDHYMQEMAESIVKAEKSEQTYKALVACYADTFGPGVTADYKAADDVRLQTAISDGAYYRDRSQTYALGAIALMLHEQQEKK